MGNIVQSQNTCSIRCHNEIIVIYYTLKSQLTSKGLICLPETSSTRTLLIYAGYR